MEQTLNREADMDQTMGFIDTHSHIFLEEFDADRDEVVQRAREAGIVRLLLPNIDAGSLDRLMATCRAYPGYCLPMTGLHPTSVDSDWRTQFSLIQDRLAELGPVVAVGEIGMDLYWDSGFCREQMEALDAQARWAMDMDLPVVIHCRSAFPQIRQVLEPLAQKGLRGVFHSFSGDGKELEGMLAFEGFMIGVNGIATFRRSAIPELISRIPLDRLLLETDCPYLSPVPKRGSRNESAYLRYTLEFMAGRLGMDPRRLAVETSRNARRLFRLDL